MEMVVFNQKSMIIGGCCGWIIGLGLGAFLLLREKQKIDQYNLIKPSLSDEFCETFYQLSIRSALGGMLGYLTGICPLLFCSVVIASATCMWKRHTKLY